MVGLTIDGKFVEASEGATLLEAARRAGASIPTLCHMEGIRPLTSCMLCVVKDVKSGRLLPSCSVEIEDGMEIETGGEEVLASRRAVLELLLSEHVGDCEAPCLRTCPGGG